MGMEPYINRLLEPIRKEFANPHSTKLTLDAYPPPTSKFCILFRISLYIIWIGGYLSLKQKGTGKMAENNVKR